MDRLAYDIADVAEMLGVSDDAIRDEIKDGRLIARKVRRRTVVTADDLAAYIGSLRRAVESQGIPAPSPAPAPVSLKRHAKSGRVVKLFDPIARGS